MSVEETQWLEKTILASSFRDKLLELGEEDFVKYTEKQSKKIVQDYLIAGGVYK